MKKWIGFALLALLGVSAWADPSDSPELRTTSVKETEFSKGPEAVVKVARIYGDPAKEGLWIQWMKMPKGAVTPPHWHDHDEIFTVISGSVHIGLGDKVDKAKSKLLRAGGFAVVPAKAHHFGWTDEGALLQVQGLGPFQMNWLEKDE